MVGIATVLWGAWLIACDGADPTPGPVLDSGRVDDAPDAIDVDQDGWSVADGDCDDEDPSRFPTADEGCDGIDNDCDGALGPNEVDLDGDGFRICEGDCDDERDDVYPNAEERCDQLDNDCDNELGPDEQDGDGDGFSVCEGDCDPSRADVYPGAPDVLCDGLNADCGDDPERDVPGDFSTIQGALDSAVAGDTICISAGTYVENLEVTVPDVHLLGLQGSAKTVVDANGSGRPLFGDAAADGLVVEGLTLRNGVTASSGGGLLFSGGALEMRDVVLEANASERGGGGLGVFSASLQASGLLVRNNVVISARGGGGILIEDTSALLDEVEVSGNLATYDDGGGIVVLDGSSLMLSNAIVADNDATGGLSVGGGIAVLDDATATLSHVRIEGNVARVAGGLGTWHDGTANLDNVVVSRNQSTLGAGICMCGAGASTLRHVRVVENQGSGAGGGGLAIAQDAVDVEYLQVLGNTGRGIYVERGDVTLRQATVVGNEGCRGAALLDLTPEDNTVELYNSIVADNVDVCEDGEVIRASKSPTLIGSTVFWNNLPAVLDGIPDPIGVDGNAVLDPSFLDTTSADPTSWDVHLSATSDAIGVGEATVLDPDGSPSDPGAFGGPHADEWDLDGDTAPAWWQPGPYDTVAYPVLNLDCDDEDPRVGPASGC